MKKLERFHCAICELGEKYPEVMANYLLFIDSLNTLYTNMHQDGWELDKEFVRLTMHACTMGALNFQFLSLLLETS